LIYADDALLLKRVLWTDWAKTAIAAMPRQSEKGISAGCYFFVQLVMAPHTMPASPMIPKDDDHRRDEKEKSYAKDTQAKACRERIHGTSQRTLGRALAGSDGNQLLI
jgi:hypothetical protein